MSFMIDQILASSSSTNKSRPPLHSLTNTLSSSSTSILANKQKERRMWQCEMCPKAFDRPSLLTRHIRTHTGKISNNLSSLII
jgi:uncharacterized Zn-finger protein